MNIFTEMLGRVDEDISDQRFLRTSAIKRWIGPIKWITQVKGTPGCCYSDVGRLISSFMVM